MSTWYKPPAIVSLFAEFDELAPARSRGSDGTIGDQAHEDRVSDHNIDDGPDQGATPYEDADGVPEIHAADVTATLNRAGWTMSRATEIIVTRHREGDDDRLQNVIYNARIASRSWGWTWRAYSGSNAHTKHAHFSLRYTDAAERDTRPWGLLEADDVTKEEMKAALREVMPDVLTSWAKTEDGRMALAKAVVTTDNVVSLDGPAGQPQDAGLQSLVQWPRAGYAKGAFDRAATALERLDALTADVATLLERTTPPPPAGQND